MPFHKIDAQAIIKEKCNNDVDFKRAYDTVKKEYSIIREVVKTRKELGLTQENLAKKIGVKQQVISRFEQEKHIPTLDNFIRILDGIGLELVLQKKRETHTILPK
jgi:ribosome-binding protein aMBF1 (putative translation factor)